MQSRAPSAHYHGAPNQTGRKGSGDPGQLHGNLQEVRHPSLTVPEPLDRLPAFSSEDLHTLLPSCQVLPQSA
ncbi:MAG: hypothetical protein DWH82_12180 [Planctomycetota bacterium]|nr:MAG: hypothetical protein DWH82_12180 [Planctomycetota bacterium]